jgi:outer membrane immunogenic protein
MKKIFLLGFAAITVLAGGPAVAADMPVKVSSPAMMRPACAQFGGFYIGGHAGWGYHDYKWSDRDAWSSENSDDLQRSNVTSSKGGFIGGAQGGYNWQQGCTLFGVEADYAWGRISHSVFETDGDTGIDTDSLTIQSRLRGLGSLKARTGIIVDNLLIYVTGGFAVGDFSRTYTQTDLNAPASEVFSYSKFKWGWTAGFGTEWAINNNWSLKSEVLYARFESDEQNFICVTFCTAPGENKRFGNDDSLWTTKIGINYRWGVR